jgi:hypothetical protein
MTNPSEYFIVGHTKNKTQVNPNYSKWAETLYTTTHMMSRSLAIAELECALIQASLMHDKYHIKEIENEK